MKLTALFILVATAQLSAKSIGQKISMNCKNVPLGKAFSIIEKQCDYNFIYSKEQLKDAKNVTLQLKDVGLNSALDKIFEPQMLSYTIIDRYIVVKEKTVVSIPDTKTQAQGENIIVSPPPIPIKGIVKDENGNPLPGASVVVGGTKFGTTTNENGEFSLNVTDRENILIVSYVGYESTEINIKGKTSVTVILKSKVQENQEIVVIGYGTQKKVDVTGAVSTVSAKDFSERPVTNITNALQGKLPGVTITTNNGQPGRDGGSINVRGIGTGLGGSPAVSSPMVIVDGIVASLGEVNPNDIQNVTVLKDASSAAIYGARASNGVILITTKSGRKGKLQLSYDGYFGWQSITRKPDFLPSYQQAQLYNEALTNEGSTPAWTATDIQQFKDGSDATGAHPNTDWLSLFYTKPGYQQSHNLTLSGGDDKTTYMFSLGYFDQQGNVIKTDYTKYNTRFNINSQVNKKLSVSANLAYLYAPFTEPQSSLSADHSFSQVIRQINRISNTVPSKWPNGALGYVSDGSPLAWLQSASINKWQGYTLTGNAGLDYSPINGLHLKPSFGYRLSMDQQQQFISDIQYYQGGAVGTPLTPIKYQGPNNLTDYSDRTTYTLLQFLADYEKTIQGHHFKVLVGTSQEYSIYNNFSAYRQGFLNNSISQINAGPAIGQQTTGTASDWALQSVFGRINYDFKEKYLLEANLRYDGSSRFASGKQWGGFPSFSAGWIVSKESFFKQLNNVINYLKIRGSWGKLGNQQISNYPTISTVAPGQNYSFNQALVAGIAPTSGANASITWEETQTSGVGLDASVLKNKLSFSIDYFNKKTNNILMVLPTGAPYALSAPYQNAGAMKNTGFEFYVDYKGKTGQFSYDINANLTYVKNTVTDLKGTGPLINGGTFYNVGYPFQSLYGLQALGIYRTQDDLKKYPSVLNSKVGLGDIIYKDQNNDGVIDASDRVYLGTYFPKYTFGLNATVSYKNFDLTLFFQGAAGVKEAGGNLIGQIGPNVQKPTSVFLDRWTTSNINANFPRAWYRYTQDDPSTNPSSFWVKDASYVRLKNLQLAYNLPDKVTKALHLNKVKIFYSGQNMLTFTKFYKWIDPEVGSTASIYSYPQVMVNTFGLNVTF